MNLTKYKYLKRTLTKFLGLLKRNVVLDEIDSLQQTDILMKKLNRAMIAQVEKAITVELVEQVMLLTRKADTNQDIQDIVERELGDVNDQDDSLFAEFVILMTIGANLAGQHAVDMIAVNKTFGLENKAFIINRIQQVLEGITHTTAGFISRKIEEAKGGLLTIEEATDYVREETINSLGKRAEMIVRNESAQVVGTVTNEVYRKSGVVELKWVTAMDERVCSICEPLDGTVIRLGSAFVGGGGTRGEYPPIHISCRCFVEPAQREGTQVWTGK